MADDDLTLDEIQAIFHQLPKMDIEHIVRRYCTWFYNQMGSVYATSAKIAKKMAQEGIQSKKIRMIDSRNASIESDPPKEDGLFKGLFQLPLNWKLYDNPSSAKAAI